MDGATKNKFENKGQERAVLSCILKDSGLLVSAEAKLRDYNFISDHHRALYSVVSSLYFQGAERFDLMSVVNEATDKGVLDLIGGAEYINALFNASVDPSNFDIFVNKILDASAKYRLYLETEHIQRSIISNVGSSDGQLSGEELLASAESNIISVALESQHVEDAVNIGEGLTNRLEFLAENPVNVLGLSTGIELVDKAINGLTPGSLTVVAARQKCGKSTLLVNMAAHIAYTVGRPVLYIDTEMSTAEVQTRLVSHLSGVPERAITNGQFINNKILCENVWRACRIIEKGCFFHRYYPGFSVDGVSSLIRKYKVKENIGAFFFDYIKLPEGSNASSFKEHQLLGNVTTALKDVAGRLDIAGVAAAQIKRSDSGAVKTRFHDSDVADSDRIGRYCNNLLTVARKSKKEMEEDGDVTGKTYGTHRLQVLLSRGGTSLYNGIDIYCDFPTLSMRQTKYQANGMHTFEDTQGSSW